MVLGVLINFDELKCLSQIKSCKTVHKHIWASSMIFCTNNILGKTTSNAKYFDEISMHAKVMQCHLFWGSTHRKCSQNTAFLAIFGCLFQKFKNKFYNVDLVCFKYSVKGVQWTKIEPDITFDSSLMQPVLHGPSGKLLIRQIWPIFPVQNLSR